jgi:hypothetical protein
MRVSFPKILLACVVLGSATYGFSVLRSSYNIGAGEEKRRQIELLERENEKLQREIAAKQNHLDDLKQNPDHLKLEIEDKLKLVSPGTKQFILQDGKANPETTEPRP